MQNAQRQTVLAFTHLSLRVLAEHQVPLDLTRHSNPGCYFTPHPQAHDASRMWMSVPAPHPVVPMVPAPTWQEVSAVLATRAIVALPVIRTSMTVTPVSSGELLGWVLT